MAAEIEGIKTGGLIIFALSAVILLIVKFYILKD